MDLAAALITFFSGLDRITVFLFVVIIVIVIIIMIILGDKLSRLRAGLIKIGADKYREAGQKKLIKLLAIIGKIRFIPSENADNIKDKKLKLIGKIEEKIERFFAAEELDLNAGNKISALVDNIIGVINKSGFFQAAANYPNTRKAIIYTFGELANNFSGAEKLLLSMKKGSSYKLADKLQACLEKLESLDVSIKEFLLRLNKLKKKISKGGGRREN